MDYNEWKKMWDDNSIWEYLQDQSGKKKDDYYMSYYYYPKTFNWIIEEKQNIKRITDDDRQSLESTYKNDDAYKKALNNLMDEINSALQVGDKDWFERVSKEYTALKMECMK